MVRAWTIPRLTWWPQMELQTIQFEHTGPQGRVSLSLKAAPDLDALITDDTDPERIPYWAVLWESAPRLARYLLEAGDWGDVEVLELGCGTGLVGLALAQAGARVMQTDLFPEAVALAAANARVNGLASVQHLAADWCAWPIRQRWPVIVASDVLYERSVHAPLLDVLQASLAPGGTVHLGDPRRKASTAFLARAEADWHVKEAKVGAGAAFSLSRR